MNNENDQKSKGSFWSTLPGILTGTAAVITALGGLITVLAANGILKFPGSTQATLTPTSTASLVGNWSGKVAAVDGSFDAMLNLSFANCNVHEVCGSFTVQETACSGTLTLEKVDGNVSIFKEKRTSGDNNTCGIGYEQIQQISATSISYGFSTTGNTKDVTATGVLAKKP